MASALALYETGDVTILTPENFENLVLQSKSVWIVQFYAPWCGFSKRIESDYKAMATLLKNLQINVGALDAHTHSSLGDSYNVNGYPTIKIFGGNKSNPIPTYEGNDDTMQDIINAAWAEKSKLTRRFMCKKN